MTPKPLVAGLLLAAAALVATLYFVPRLGHSRALTGYVEGEPLYLAAPVSGTVDQMLVQRGDRVVAGQALFVVDPAQLKAQRDQAEADVEAASAQAQDARKGQRAVELAVFDANIAAAEARARDAAADLRRIRPLVQKAIYAPARLDDAQAAYQAAQAQVTAARRQRDAAALGARETPPRLEPARTRSAPPRAGCARPAPCWPPPTRG